MRTNGILSNIERAQTRAEVRVKRAEKLITPNFARVLGEQRRNTREALDTSDVPEPLGGLEGLAQTIAKQAIKAGVGTRRRPLRIAFTKGADGLIEGAKIIETREVLSEPDLPPAKGSSAKVQLIRNNDGEIIGARFC